MLPFLDSLRYLTHDNIFLVTLLRLGVAVFCGGVIGLERGRKRRPAGFRTHILVCLGATLRLTAGNSDDIKHKIKELLAQRREKQPLEFASAGSYFKRPEGDFAGRLIELCGLKGFAVGDAQVSQKHAGFVINRGGATFDDVMRLEDHIVKTVYEQTGVTLQREVEIIR